MRHLYIFVTLLAAAGTSIAAGIWILTGYISVPLISAAVALTGAMLITHEISRREKAIDRVVAAMQRGELAQAVKMTDDLLQILQSSRGKAAAIELQARAWLGQEQPIQAYQALQKMPAGREGSAALRGALLLFDKRPHEARDLLEPEWAKLPSDGLASVLCEAYVQCGQLAKATDVVHGRKRIGQPVWAQLETSLLRAGAFELAVDVSKQAFDRFGLGDHAYNVACSLCQLEEHCATDDRDGALERGDPDTVALDEAMRWLERAVQAGYDDVAYMREDDDLCLLRERAGWEDLMLRARDEAGRSARLEAVRVAVER